MADRFADEKIKDRPFVAFEKIEGQIFMGSGEFADAEMKHCHELLDKAFTLLGGMQQPPSVWEPEGSGEQHMAQVAKDEMRLKAMANEIYLAITGIVLP